MLVLFIILNAIRDEYFPSIASLPSERAIGYQFAYLMVAFVVFGIFVMMAEGATLKIEQHEKNSNVLFWFLIVGEIILSRFLFPDPLHRVLFVTVSVVLITSVQQYMKQFSFYGEKGITA